MSISVALPEETFTIEVENWFDDHRLGSDNGPYTGRYALRRGTDGMFFDESGTGDYTEATLFWNATTPAGGTSDPHHHFDISIPAGAQVGDTYTIWIETNNDPYTRRVWNITVRSQGLIEMVPHEHIGADSWDLPIARTPPG